MSNTFPSTGFTFIFSLFTLNSFVSVPLNIVISTSVPSSPFISFDIADISLALYVFPFTLTIISPGSIPAFSAGDPFIGDITFTLSCFLSAVMYIPIPT